MNNSLTVKNFNVTECNVRVVKTENELQNAYSAREDFRGSKKKSRLKN